MKPSMINILRETPENDITNIKEGKKIYRKIVNNISSVNYAPTDKNDFVIDTTGKKHQLHGIKFNLNQIEKHYDLNLLFVHILGSNNLCHYNKKNNRMVFFIISQVNDPDDVEHNKYLTRVRFNSWIDENSFVHEFIHFLDFKRFSPTHILKPRTNDYNYFNSPEEYNTYYYELLNNIIKNKKNLLQLNFKQFLKQSLKLGRQDFLLTLNDDNKRKLQNRLYKLYDHMRNNVINENKNIMKLSMITILNENKKYHEGKLIFVKPLELGKGIKIDHNVLSLINKIKENGWVVPISITSDGFIVDGEHRYKALMEIGIDKIPAYVGKQLGSSGRLEQTYQGLPIDVKNLYDHNDKSGSKTYPNYGVKP